MNAHIFGYAPGKVILVGEHAVVYGQPALAATIDRGVRVIAAEKNEDFQGPVLRGHVQGLGAVRARPDDENGKNGEGPEALRRALACLCDIFGPRVRQLEFVVESAIPSGCGLGSSAALTVALVRGVQRFLGEDDVIERVIERAHRLESVFHGTPSGIDHTAIAHGGLVYFQRSADSFEAKPIQTKRTIKLVIAVAGPHSGTALAVKALASRANRHPKIYEHLYQGIGELAVAAREHIELGQLAALGEIWDINQGLLNALGVSTPRIETLCTAARRNGALGAKLTGAGCGGAILALVDDNAAAVKKALEDEDAVVFETSIGPKLDDERIICSHEEQVG